MFVSLSNKHVFLISARYNVGGQHIYSCYATTKDLKQNIGMDTLKISQAIVVNPGLNACKSNY